jgi:hypothetical protein
MKPETRYPAVFNDLDAAAIRTQERFLTLQRLELIALVAAAVVLEFTWLAGPVAWAPMAGAALLLAAISARVINRRLGLETAWTTSRGAAETVKSLLWRYGVGSGDDDTTDALRSRIERVLERYGITGPGHQHPDDADHFVGGAVVALRHEPDPLRKRAVYLEARVREQQAWYRSRGEHHGRQADLWNRVVVVAELGAVALAVAKGLQWVAFDWVGILGAAAAAAVAWRQTRQLAALATSYSATVDELDDLGRLLADAEPQRWDDLVERTEEVMGREHKLWGLRRTLA